MTSPSQRLKDIASESGPQWHSWRDYVAAPTSWYIRTEADAHADKLKRALIVAAEALKIMDDALADVELNVCYDCSCANMAHDARTEAQKMMESI